MSDLQTGCSLHSDERKLVDNLQSKLKIKKEFVSYTVAVDKSTDTDITGDIHPCSRCPIVLYNLLNFKPMHRTATSKDIYSR